MIFSAAMNPITPIGRLIRNTQCQEAISTSQPPSVGPISGPISAGIAMKLIARRKSARATVLSTASRPTGSNIAPPMPCTTRAATSCGNCCAAAHSNEPSVNTMIAARKVRRVPKRSAIHPEAGMNIATANA